MAAELVQQLVDSGVHFGHRASRWNPKMKPYIFGKRNTIHIIDIRETLKGLLRAKKLISQIVASNKDILFVGTKRQARLSIKSQATRVGMPYVIERWLGGTLTNFRTIRSRLGRLQELETAESDGTALEYSKKMISSRTREKAKIDRNLSGIRNMEKLPGAMVVVDVHREKSAVCEARKLGISTICLIDTDSDPDFADIPIPGNDDAIRAIDLILGQLADAVDEGKRARAVAEATDGAGAPKRRRMGGPDDSPEAIAARAGADSRVPGTDGSEAGMAPRRRGERTELASATAEPEKPSI